MRELAREIVQKNKQNSFIICSLFHQPHRYPNNSMKQHPYLKVQNALLVSANFTAFTNNEINSRDSNLTSITFVQHFFF